MLFVAQAAIDVGIVLGQSTFWVRHYRALHVISLESLCPKMSIEVEIYFVG